jgi:hypothetical protein
MVSVDIKPDDEWITGWRAYATRTMFMKMVSGFLGPKPYPYPHHLVEQRTRYIEKLYGDRRVYQLHEGDLVRDAD